MALKQKAEQDKLQARHQVKGGVYLVVADETQEFVTALKYAGLMAKANACHVGILTVMEPQDFVHWGNIEARMQKEQRDAVEELLWRGSNILYDFECDRPGFYVDQGSRVEALTRVIEEDSNIAMLILGGGTGSGGPGPLVAHFAGKGLSKLRVPVLVVPDHLDS